MNPSSPIESVDVVIVTHQSAPVVGRCLLAVRRELLRLAVGGRRGSVIVADCGSSDGTLEQVREHGGDTTVLALENLGFAGGCNAALTRSSADAVLFLNPDAVLSPRSLGTLVRYLDEHPHAAAVGPQLCDANGALAVSAQRFPSLAGELRRTFDRVGRLLRIGRDDEVATSGRVDWVPGACLLVRRRALQLVGWFDRRYFLYYEEVDWCRRARAAGLEVHVVRDALVAHVGGASVSEALGTRRHDEHHERSRRRYFRTHHGPLEAALVELLHGLRSRLDGRRRRRVLEGRA